MTMNMLTNMNIPIPMPAKPTAMAMNIPIPMIMNTTTPMGQMMQPMIMTATTMGAMTMTIPGMKQSPTPIPMIDQG